MSDRLANKIALVTGAGSGMGRAIAVEFAAQGAVVACLDLNVGSANATAKSLAGTNHFALECDIADEIAVVTAAGEAERRLGRIDILVNCAGVLDGYAAITETSTALWDKILNINLKGMFLTSRAVLPGMIAKKQGTIVNISSIAGLVAGGGGAAYTASKHGVIGLTRQTAYDYGKLGIRANAICPGAVETGMTKDILNSDNMAVMDMVRSVPAGRHGQPEEIAKLALYLASDESSFVHGAVMAIDGGWTVK